MEPLKNGRATLVDLLERVLDKGLILNADIVISISGIPLIGVNLRAALAGMTTMLKYGLMVDLDKRIREYYRVKEAREKPPLIEGEEILLRTTGSHLYKDGIMCMWRVGHLYLTDKRLIILRREPAETLLEISLVDVKGMQVVEAERHKWKRREIHLQLPSGAVIIHAKDADRLAEALRGVVERCTLRP